MQKSSVWILKREKTDQQTFLLGIGEVLEDLGGHQKVLDVRFFPQNAIVFGRNAEKRVEVRQLHLRKVDDVLLLGILEEIDEELEVWIRVRVDRHRLSGRSLFLGRSLGFLFTRPQTLTIP